MDVAPQDRAVRQECLEGIVLMLAPIVPHVAESLWQGLGHPGSVMQQAWPKPDPAALKRSTLELVVQVNGKLRGKIQVAADASRETIEKAALAEPFVQPFVQGKDVKKIVVVPGKLVNVVAA